MKWVIAADGEKKRRATSQELLEGAKVIVGEGGKAFNLKLIPK